MKILYETNKIRIENEYEAVFLIDKETGKILLKANLYGNPQCGLIDKENQWAIIAGEHLFIWTPKSYKKIENEGLRWIHSVRAKDSETIEILTDPWSEKSSIWEMSTKTLDLKKIRDFDEYRGREFAENINW